MILRHAPILLREVRNIEVKRQAGRRAWRSSVVAVAAVEAGRIVVVIGIVGRIVGRVSVGPGGIVFLGVLGGILRRVLCRLALPGTAAADVVDAELARQLVVARAAAPRRSLVARSLIAQPPEDTLILAADAGLTAEHRADAIEQQRAADRARRSRCRSTEKRTARARRISRLRRSTGRARPRRRRGLGVH